MGAVLTRTIVKIPEAVGELVVIAIVVGCFVGLHAILQRRFKTEVLRRHNDVTGYLFSAVGVLYAVLLGFVVVVVWEKYDGTVANVQAEVDAAGDLYHVVDGFPQAARTKIRAGIARYARSVIDVEWPAMARNQEIPEAGSRLLEDAAYGVNSFSPTDRRGLNAQQAAIGSEQRLFDARRQRLIRAQPAVPSVLWFALVAGALAMVTFCYIFGVENRPAQLLMTAMLVGLIAILFVVIGEFAGPFSGSVMISPDGWSSLAQRMGDIQ
jgi:Protein of unknown function (DUF4239)